MPILNITEYIDTNNGNPVEPPCAHQTVVLGDEPTESVPFHRMTRCVRIAAEVNCLVSISNENVAPQSLITAGEKELRIVHPGAGFKLAAVLASGEMQPGSVGVLGQGVAFFEILTSPSKYKSMLDKLLKARDDARAATAVLGDLKTKASALKKERDGFDVLVKSQQEQLRQSEADLEAERQQFEAEKSKHATSVAALAEDRTAFETSKQEYDAQLAELNRFKKSFSA